MLTPASRVRRAALLTAPLLFTGCGGKPGAAKLPLRTERAAIDAAIHRGVRPRAGEHLVVLSVRIARSDAHFASAAIQQRDANGRKASDIGVVVLMQAGGAWLIVLGPGTAFAEECTQATAKPVRDLMCPNPYAVLGV